METTKKADNKLTTPTFRVSFPAVFQARANVNNPGAPAKFSVVMLFNTADPVVAKGLETMKAAVIACLTEKFGPDQAKWPKNMRMPFRKGEEKDYEGYGKGVVFVSASSKMKPGLVDAALQPIIEPNEFYAGCYARATVNAYYYDKAGNKGVAFGLRNIQKVKDGEAFSGAGKPENDFDALEAPVTGSKAEVGATAGSDSAFPF